MHVYWLYVCVCVYVGVCVHARKIGKDKPGGGFSQGINSSFLLPSCKGWDGKSCGFVCVGEDYMCEGEAEWEGGEYDIEKKIKIKKE